MRLRMLRVGVGLLLGASGALMYAASWQRWAGPCSDGWTAEACLLRQDHLFDFLLPTEPWEPAGGAAGLAGLSLLVFALALPVLPWALTGRRPGPFSAIALVLSEIALVAVGVATLRSGLSGEVVDAALGVWSVTVWFIGPPILLVRFAVSSRGWTRAASVLLALGTPLVGTLYAIGDFDTRPWWEAVSGTFTALAGLCLLVAAAWRPRPSAGADAATPAAVGSGTRPT